jgi:hypothetical protein
MKEFELILTGYLIFSAIEKIFSKKITK